MGQGYAALTYETYQAVERQGPSGYWQRFFNGGNINVIQCAEQLEGPREVVRKTYSNCSWQNETLSAAQAVAHGDRGQLANLVFSLAFVTIRKKSSSMMTESRRQRFNTWRPMITPASSAISPPYLLTVRFSAREIAACGTECSHT
jgi:hypothetical protein